MDLGHVNVVLKWMYCLFVCLFVGIKPAQPYSASCAGREVNPLGVITQGQYLYPIQFQFDQFQSSSSSLLSTLKIATRQKVGGSTVTGQT